LDGVFFAFDAEFAGFGLGGDGFGGDEAMPRIAPF
jgi:hypothetical protein